MPSNDTYGGQGKAVVVDPLGGFAVIDVRDFRNSSDTLATLAAFVASSFLSSLI
jgi:hypothetical protein